MWGMYFRQTARMVTGFSGGSSSAPLHRRNSGTAQRMRLFQNRVEVQPKAPTSPAKPPAAEAWIRRVPKIATVLAASMGMFRRAAPAVSEIAGMAVLLSLRKCGIAQSLSQFTWIQGKLQPMTTARKHLLPGC